MFGKGGERIHQGFGFQDRGPVNPAKRHVLSPPVRPLEWNPQPENGGGQ
jgi:hypothetical protein